MKDIKNKVLHLNSHFVKDLPTVADEVESIFISGYASVNTPDRAGDVVPSSVWAKGMDNYLKNPIILAYHDHDDPIGRMVEHKVDSKGLWIKARISAASTEIFNLVKDNVLTAFSVAFRVLDAEYNAVTELFVVKELELVEISVVSVPCNQDTLFSLSKSFTDDSEYKLFKSHFAPQSESAKGLETSTVAKSTNLKEIGMTPEELQKMLADVASAAATQATNAMLEKQTKMEADRKAAELAELEVQKRIQAAVAAVTPSTTGAEALLADITKRFETESEKTKSILAGLETSVKEKAAELEALQKSKMSFASEKKEEISYADKEKAVLLGFITKKSIPDTKFGKQLLEKAGAHVASATWELEVSMNMEAEVRRRLVVAPILRSIAMKTNVMTIPVNPEAGIATWITNAQFGTTTSAGTAQTHQLKEITLNAYKVSTSEYLAYEEEEDTLIVLLPIIRDAMIRRVARAMDKAYLLGAGAGADPVKGLATYDATSVVVPTNTGVATIANLRAMRKDLGALGLDTAEVQYIVSTDVYYDLLDDTQFQTMDKVGTQASLLTGQVGVVGNSPVLVSAEFPTKAGGAATAATNIGAICVASSNFLAGNQRGLRFDTQDLVETQRKVLVASLRTGLTQVSTNLGQGVSTLRWS